MHWFTRDVVERFVEGRYEVRFSDSPTLWVSRETLPERATVVVMMR
jgi:hypothetical protein